MFGQRERYGYKMNERSKKRHLNHWFIVCSGIGSSDCYSGCQVGEEDGDTVSKSSL